MSKPFQVNPLGYLLLICLVIGLDQGVKFIALTLVPTFHNQGVILGLFPGYSFYLVLVGFILLLQVVVKNRFNSASALLLGGAASNLVDRLRFGFVMDYIDLKVFPVFNLADVAIVLGAVFLIKEFLSQNSKVKTTTQNFRS